MGKSYNCGYRDGKGRNNKGNRKGGFKKFGDSENEMSKLKERYNINFSKFK